MKVLVVDDEKGIRDNIKDYLVFKGIETLVAGSGEAAIASLDPTFDLVILDVMMDGMSGLETCQEIRQAYNLPVLFLSALSYEDAIVKGYLCGGDDYMVKPFSMAVLYHKVVAMIERYRGDTSSHLLRSSGISLDLQRMSVSYQDEDIHLSLKDVQILALLMENESRILSREAILSHVWGYDYAGDDRTIDSHIKRIRKALKEGGRHIVTVTGCGYRFEGAHE